ncbi:MAG: outer membrane protein assembly factor BamA [Alphaproteobacteria bacterium]|nr:outer membrane protein assembly factor BamA [Alphaproteobacteria bacterium]
MQIASSKIRILFTVMMLFMGSSVASAQQLIRQISIEGAERVEAATVVSYLDLRIGDLMTQASFDRALKGLFSTGLFADVSLRQEDTTLVVSVVENPVINQIVFEGNDKLDDAELLSELQLRPRHVFTRTKVQSDVSRLYQVYRRNGRFSVSIEPKVIRLEQNRVNLIFEIVEGDITKVQSIRFIGNTHFDDSSLRSEISTKETVWYRFITADDRYDPDRLSYDQEMLRRFYLKEGYADFRLISAVAELSNDRDSFFITFTIDEGERYKFADLKINSQLRNFDSSVLDEHIIVSTGEWYDSNLVQEISDRLTDALGDLQYAFVSVRPDIKRNREEQTIDISFQINETPRVFVERIDVNGNVRTLDKVIRREMLLVEGDPFNKSKLARSEQRVRNLNFFENITMSVKPGSTPDRTVVDIEVSEKSTGELSIGAGFSTNDGPLADFRIRERNLLGKGQDMLLSATIAGERTEFDFAFTEPHFLDRDVSAGVDLFHITRDLQDESSFNQRRTGGAFRVGFPLSERWRDTVRLRLERNDITDVDSNASRFIRDQEGQRDTAAISQRLTYDNRNSSLFPTEGLLYWLDTEFAGLGGDAEYLSGKTGVSYFYSIVDNWVLNLLGEVGAIGSYSDEDVAINERFFLGGSTLRGFEQAGLGPRDIVTDDSLGGNYFYRGSAEVTFPVFLPEELGVKGHAFSDFGTLWELDSKGINVEDDGTIRASAGVGLSWRSPFGPIRLDWAVPFAKEDFDEEEVFRFNFGTRF